MSKIKTRNALSDDIVLSLISETLNLKIIDSYKIYTLNSGESICLMSSRFYANGKGYWYGIPPSKINVLKNNNIDFVGLIIGHEGVVKLPLKLVLKYVEYSDKSLRKDKNSISHYHIRLKYREEELILYNKKEEYIASDYFVPLNEDDLIIENLNGLSKDVVFQEAMDFEDFADQYRIKEGRYKVRNESTTQKARIALLEDHTCQICGFKYEYINREGKIRWIIEIDHIIDKARGGGEKMDNLVALCPNCHAKKTRGIIYFDMINKKVYSNDEEIILNCDNHLFR